MPAPFDPNHRHPLKSINIALYYSELTETNATLNNRIGKIKAIKALNYFLLVQTYGSVILSNNFISSPVLSFEHNSAEEVYDFIVAKMNEALNMAADLALDDSALELTGEYLWWFDLKRTGTLVALCDKYNKDIETHYFDGSGGQKILRPIPQSALDLNQNKEFGQNPGY